MTSASESNEIQQWLQLARTLARQAGDMVVSMQRAAADAGGSGDANGLSIDEKSSSVDLVTSADVASQKLIFGGIRAAYPTHRLIGEEDAVKAGPLDERPTWIVDAIDGTTNFVHGLPDWAVSIAVSLHGAPVAGAVYNPARSELFSAWAGGGAYLNDAPVRVRDVQRLSAALVLTEWGYARDADAVAGMLDTNRRLLEAGTRGVRQIGSGSLDMCYVAVGRADAVYCGVVGCDAWHIWDYAAAFVVAREAGAALRTVDGGTFDVEAASMVCAAPGVVDELLGVLANTARQ